MKLSSRLLMLFVKIYAKNIKFGYLNPILEKLGVTHHLAWWLIEKPMVDFLFALTDLSSLPVMVPELWGEICTAWLFLQGVNLFVVKFYLDRVVPHQPFFAPESYRHWATQRWRPHPSASLIWYNTGVWWTDRQMDGCIFHNIYGCSVL